MERRRWRRRRRRKAAGEANTAAAATAAAAVVPAVVPGQHPSAACGEEGHGVMRLVVAEHIEMSVR